MKTKDLKIEGTAKATADDNNFIVRFKEGVEPTVTGGAVQEQMIQQQQSV